jgi:hypothetical protein
MIRPPDSCDSSLRMVSSFSEISCADKLQNDVNNKRRSADNAQDDASREDK